MALAQRLFGNLRRAPNKPSDKTARSQMEDLLKRHGVPFTGIGWDYYDDSLEIHGVPPEYRLSDEARKAIAAEQFSTVYVNHTDGWETHYSLTDISREGWRVSYPHKRGDGTKPILVEKHVPGWPQDWFDTGYVVIKP